MNGYLVVAYGPLDDLPIGLFDNEADAIKLSQVTTEEDVLKSKLLDILGRDVSYVLGIDVLRFENGCPKELVFTRSYE